MRFPELERVAKLIAENVISAFEHGHFGIGSLGSTARTAAVSELMRRLLSVMPTENGAILTAACDTAREDISAPLEFTGPRVEAVYLGDGSVTIGTG